MAPFVAASIGYAWRESGRWIDGTEGVALLPAAPERGVAVFARKEGDHRHVVVAPYATDRPKRDAAVRLAIALRADALVVGLTFDRAVHAGLVRAALATLGSARAGVTRTVFLVREDPSDTTSSAQVSSWLDDGAGRDATLAALEAVGVPSALRPMDAAMREVAVRTAPDASAVVTITIGPGALEMLSLDTLRHAAARLGDEVRAFDGTLAGAATTLLDRFAPNGVACADDIAAVVRSAGAEASVMAAHRLKAELKRGCAVATLVRAPKAAHLLVLAHSDKRDVLVGATLGGGEAFTTTSKDALAACLAAPLGHGVCSAEVQR
jgi:hypothetical protein